MIERNRVQEAIDNLINEGTKITVSNTRRKLLELFGYAGNNNELAPIVKEIKTELKQKAKGKDIEKTVAIAITNAITMDMPTDLENKAMKYIKLLHQEIYNSIDSTVDNERIKQLEQENIMLRNQNTEYQKLKQEFEIMQKYHKKNQQELIETNRLLDMQLVAQGKAQGKAKVEEYMKKYLKK